MQLEILEHQEDWIAINKPHGLLVHRTKMANDATTSVLKILKAQIDQKLYPVHRLDRKTSGVLLLALNAETQRSLNFQFSERKIKKCYHALVRGYTDDEGVIDYAIKNEKGKVKDAFTKYQTLERYELDLPFGKFSTSRYSLVNLSPTTGRYHQLRMHMAHIFHPILGDRPHGCNKQNKLFKESYAMTKMLLHAYSLEFEDQEKKLLIQANYSLEFSRMLDIFRQKKRDIVHIGQ